MRALRDKNIKQWGVYNEVKNIYNSFFNIYIYSYKNSKSSFVSDTYKQGVYSISEPTAFLTTAKLAGAPPSTLLIID